jgi:VCBS repeat-containing protein
VNLTQTGTNDGTIVWDFSLANSLTQYLAAGETVTAVYTITVSDDSGTGNNTATQDVTVTITGTNDAPTITIVDVTGAVTEDASTPTLTDSGSITFAEVDETDVITSSVAIASTSTTGPSIPTDLATALNSAVNLTQTGTNDGTIDLGLQPRQQSDSVSRRRSKPSRPFTRSPSATTAERPTTRQRKM